jgi:hypothetical protein
LTGLGDGGIVAVGVAVQAAITRQVAITENRFIISFEELMKFK